MSDGMSVHEEASELVQVMRDLAAIIDMTLALPEEAEARADDKEMPGGDALVMSTPTANREAWEWRVDAAERAHIDTCPRTEHTRCWVLGDDEIDEEMCQILWDLRFWSEAWREEHDRVSDRVADIASEAEFLRQVSEWAYDREPRFEDYADTVRKARARLEALLREGIRNESGAPCLSCGRTLVRPVAERRDHASDQGGLRDWWECRNHECDRDVYDVEDYRRAVAQMHYAHAEWLPVELAVQRTGATRGSITGWASKGQVRRRRDETGRMTYRVADIETRQRKQAEVFAS